VSTSLMFHPPRQRPKQVRSKDAIRYSPRLRWACIRCGNSCRDVGKRKRRILLTARDLARITHITLMEPKQYSVTSRNSPPYTKAMKKVEGKCVFLQGTECIIYEARPLICRFYPFSLVRSPRGEIRIGFDPACSGVRKGDYRGKRFFQDLVDLAREELSQEKT